MTDAVDNPDKKHGSSEDEGPLAGERLAAARREQQISVLEVAKELHLDEPKVRALEQNQFEVLGAPVFAKGHLRKYAKLVGVSIDDVLVDYYSLTRSIGMPPVVGKVREQAREFTPGPWIAGVGVLIIVAFAYWWFVVREVSISTPGLPDNSAALTSNGVESTASGTVSETDQSDAPGAVSISDQGETVSDTAGAAADIALTNSREEREAVAEAVAAPIRAGEVQVELAFSGDCWTEITDAGGRRLFFGLGSNGRNVNVAGRAPLAVLFGNANFVSVRVNGSSYEISPADRRGNTARLTIAAQ